MKIHTKIVLLVALLVSAASCSKSFLDYGPSNAVPTPEAYETVKDLNVNLTGAYARMASYYFFGRNVPALGDIAADGFGANLTASSGHFGDIYAYSFSETAVNLEEIWAYGYKVIDNTSRIIEAAPRIKAEGKVLEEDYATLDGIVAQAHALRATAAFYLVNIFGKPYPDASAGLGIVKITTPVAPGTKVARSSVNDCYAWIESDLKAAIALYDGGAVNSKSPFYLGAIATKAVYARVLFYMQKYPEARDLANTLISTSGKTVVSAENYVSIWSTVSASTEDIYTNKKSPDDNLSANSINTLYGTYGSAATATIVDLYSATDVRLKLYAATSVASVYSAKKYPGIPGSDATNNIPVIRLPELIYIAAESTARTTSVSDAIDIAMTVAGARDPQLDKTTIPTDKDGFISWLATERFKELAQEGNRFFDARRLGLDLTRGAGHPSKYKDFVIASFVYPIPDYEVASGFGVAQTPGWAQNMPTIIK